MNIGNPGEFTIRELAEKVIELTGSARSSIFQPLPADDPSSASPDIALARQTIDWEPKSQLEDGLKETIAYFSKLLIA